MSMDTQDTPAQLLPAGWRDLLPVARVERECFLDDAWPFIDIFLMLVLPGVVRLKAMVGERMVGFASAETRSGTGWITTIGVIPPFRRRGIARALLAACEEQVGTRRVRLCVRRSNSGAQQLYEQQGYQRVDVWPRYYNGSEDAIVMEKNRSNAG